MILDEFFIPDYIILNSQHGWISIMVINNQYYVIKGYDLFYNGRNSPESLQSHDPALGGYIIQIEITCKSHVAASMHHDTWGLMQSHFFCSYY